MGNAIELATWVSTDTLHTLLHPAHTLEVAVDCVDERARQDAKWGDSSHPDVPHSVKLPCAFFGVPTAGAARQLCEDAFRRGMGSNAHILVEEVCEALEVAHDPQRLRDELVQVAAVAIKWIEQIDRKVAEAVRKEVSHG